MLSATVVGLIATVDLECRALGETLDELFTAWHTVHTGSDVMEPDTGTGGELDLDHLAGEVLMLAKQHDLTVVPALPAVTGSGLLVGLSAASVTIDWFVQTAAAAGARLLYARRRRFAVDQLSALAALPEPESDGDDGDEPPPPADLIRLRERAEKSEGQTCELGVAFVDGGVLHRWTAEAGWYARLRDEVRRAVTESGGRQERGGAGGRDLPVNTGRSWSPDEQADLARRFGEGADFKSLSAEFGRSASALRSRLRKLGLLEA
jgi:hypothetical protein